MNIKTITQIAKEINTTAAYMYMVFDSTKEEIIKAEDISELCGLNTRSIHRAAKELRDAGYITVEQQRDKERGYIIGNIYKIKGE